MDMHPRLAIKDKIGYRELIGKLENVSWFWFMLLSVLIGPYLGAAEGFQHQRVIVGSEGSQGTRQWVAT